MSDTPLSYWVIDLGPLAIRIPDAESARAQAVVSSGRGTFMTRDIYGSTVIVPVGKVLALYDTSPEIRARQDAHAAELDEECDDTEPEWLS